MPPETGGGGPAPRPYRLRPLAEADLEAIWTWTAERWSPDQADRYLRDIFTAFESLATGQRSGRPVPEHEGYLKLRTGSHVIYFRAGPDGPDIVRVLHGRMDVSRHVD